MTTKAKGGKNAHTKKAMDAKPKIKTVESKETKVDLDALRKPVAAAKIALDKAQADAKGFVEKARVMIAQAKTAYMQAYAPYREACRKNGTRCEFEGGRSGNVTDVVRFEVLKTDKGIRIAIRGKAKSEEVIPLTAFKESSISKLAYDYTDRQIGKRSEIGNKGGGLGNRIRAVLAGSKRQ